MTTAQIAMLGIIQMMRVGAEIWERRERGEMTDEELDEAVSRMQASLGETRQRLRDLIEQKRAAAGKA